MQYYICKKTIQYALFGFLYFLSQRWPQTQTEFGATAFTHGGWRVGL
jgi:hypothetical protein